MEETNLYVVREGGGGLIWTIARSPFDAADLASRAGFLAEDTFEVMRVGDKEADEERVEDDIGGAVTSLKEELLKDPSRRVVTWNEP